MFNTIFQKILDFLFYVIVELTCFFTGEFVLYLITFGRKKPRFDYYLSESLTDWILLTDLSFWIGFAFWVLTIVWIAKTFF